MEQSKSLSKLQIRDPQVRLRLDDKQQVVTYIRGNLADLEVRTNERLKESALKFLRSNSDIFGAGSRSKMTVLINREDSYGGHDVTLQQQHGRARVYGGKVRFHVRKDGTLDTVDNKLFPDLKNVPQKPKKTAEQAVKAVQTATKCPNSPEHAPELVVYRHKGKPHLTWEVQLKDPKPGERRVPAEWIGYVDAISGKPLLYYDNVQTAGPIVGMGTGYYSGGGVVNAWFNDMTNQLRDTTRTAVGGPEIITNDEDGASPSEDASNDWNDAAIPPRHQHQGPEVDAHRFAGSVVDYFQIVHGRNSYDGGGANIITTVHVGDDYNNGYWSPSDNRVRLGDGTGVAPGDDFECTDDWLAHEFTHGYTQYTCGLQYLNESGALNEAFSDIFAAFITGDWLVFEDSWLKPTAPAWRNMIDPTNGGMWNVADPINSVLAGHQPSHYSVRYIGAWDNGGVHVNSGIINNLFYLLTVGGTHTVSGITVTGIGQSAAEQMLFRCMTVNLVGNPDATFLEFREAMLDACLDLFPTDLDKLSQVKNAFNAVGIGPDLYVRDNLTDTGEEPFPGSYLWASPDVINRTSPSADPVADFSDLTDDALWQNVEFGQANSIYVRLQNRGSSDGDATINVYFISATTFGTPASWIHIGTLIETGIAPATLRIAGPLTFPAALIPSPGHYCMIAVVSDGLDPAPDHTLIASVSDYLNFVRSTNNIAYRNMNVVDMVPGLPGIFEFEVRGLVHQRDRFDLHLDLARSLPGLKLRIRGPRKALEGAVPVGLKLVGRQKDENIYQLLAGRELRRRRTFMQNGHPIDMAYGFKNLIVEKPFKMKVDYTIPEERELKELLKNNPRRSRFRLAARQVWNGKAVGAAGIEFRPKQ